MVIGWLQHPEKSAEYIQTIYIVVSEHKKKNIKESEEAKSVPKVLSDKWPQGSASTSRSWIYITTTKSANHKKREKNKMSTQPEEKGSEFISATTMEPRPPILRRGRWQTEKCLADI